MADGPALSLVGEGYGGEVDIHRYPGIAPVSPVIVGQRDDTVLANGDQALACPSDSEQHAPLRFHGGRRRSLKRRGDRRCCSLSCGKVSSHAGGHKRGPHNDRTDHEPLQVEAFHMDYLY
ncbi:hypothetical protein D9M68_239690 [compost metagenome]